MNDTEDTVRRLFAAAAEDIPPGIDLLRGMRARSRKRVVRARAVLAAGLAGIVAVAAAITLSAIRAPSAQAQVTQAASRTAAQSYQVSSVLTTGARPPVTISGEFDPARDVGEETTSQGLQIRFVGNYVYVPLTGALRKAWDVIQPAPLPAGKLWLRGPAPRLSGDASAALVLLGSAIPGVGQFTPQDLLTLLESASQVRQAGSASGPGWTGTAYTFTATTTLGGPSHLVVATSGTVDVDQQGRVRQLNATETLGPTVLKVRTTFGDFGIPVSVSAPPASQTVTLPPPGASGP
jgi:hypothetical protein